MFWKCFLLLVLALCGLGASRAAVTGEIGLHYYELSKSEGVKLAALLAQRDAGGELPAAKLEDAVRFLERKGQAQPLFSQRARYEHLQLVRETGSVGGRGQYSIEFQPFFTRWQQGKPALHLNLIVTYSSKTPLEERIHEFNSNMRLLAGGRVVFHSAADLTGASGKQYAVVVEAISVEGELAEESDLKRTRFALSCYEFPKAEAARLDRLLAAPAGAAPDPARLNEAHQLLEKLSGSKRIFSTTRYFSPQTRSVECIMQGDEKVCLEFEPITEGDARSAAINMVLGVHALAPRLGEHKPLFALSTKKTVVPLGEKLVLRTGTSQKPGKEHAVVLEFLSRGAE